MDHEEIEGSMVVVDDQLEIHGMMLPFLLMECEHKGLLLSLIRHSLSTKKYAFLKNAYFLVVVLFIVFFISLLFSRKLVHLDRHAELKALNYW